MKFISEQRGGGLISHQFSLLFIPIIVNLHLSQNQRNDWDTIVETETIAVPITLLPGFHVTWILTLECMDFNCFSFLCSSAWFKDQHEIGENVGLTYYASHIHSLAKKSALCLTVLPYCLQWKSSNSLTRNYCAVTKRRQNECGIAKQITHPFT